MAEQYAYMFDETKASPENIILLGNKGAQLAEMTSIGLPVPPGFTITTVACNKFYEEGRKWPGGLEKQVREKLSALEKKMGKKLGDPDNPLLVSVRSGSYVSMPGMMDTVLNLGLNEKSVLGLAGKTGNGRMAWDSYRRFIQMFGDVVMGVEHDRFEEILDEIKKARGAKYDTDLSVGDLKEVAKRYKDMVSKETGKEFPSDPWEQLKLSINAVFASWNNKRAVAYRRINKLRNDAGTGVNVQVMVFGNMGNGSATGVGFTRNPATGGKEHYGEYLLNAQGEDVVAGIRTPKHIDDMKRDLPKPYQELVRIYGLLEKHYRDLQDFEFTIEQGKLYLLQTRKGKRTAQAAVKISVDMVKEGILTKEEAIMRIDPNQLDQLLHKQFDLVAKQKKEPMTKGLPASPGAAVGAIAFTADRIKELADSGKKVILVRVETSPEDIEGMNAAQGILTARGGMTSHAAVVARGMGKCCVAGCGDLVINYREKTMKVKDTLLREGDWLSLDGGAGEVFQGQISTIEPEIKGEFKTLMGWVDGIRKLDVRTNADTPKDAKLARDFGAGGIGLTRTEHMFFEGERITAVREMILADNEEGRRKALDKLLPMQKSDFEGIFRAMDGLPVTIRLLDPPLHEFLPKEDKDIEEVARGMGLEPKKIREKVEALHEFNPMLGFRGCRLGVVYPEISEMQVRAIIEAAIGVNKSGGKALPEIEIPVLGHMGEASSLRALIDRVAGELIKKSGVKVTYKVGTMVELPRACMVADKLAKELDFFSFGTNDLTQTTLGFSRDDAGKFIPLYVEKGILKDDPFQVLDQEGVGSLMKIAIEKSRKAKPGMEIGICGEHGGEPSSVEFCHRIDLDYVSCSPYRVPIARLAAAQAVIREKKQRYF